MTKPYLTCWFILLTLFNGCASVTKERVAMAPGREPSLQSSAVLVEAIDHKIVRLEKLLKEKRIRLEDEPMAVVIINAYQSARSCLDGSLPAPCVGVNHELLQGLSLIDERYFSFLVNGIEPLRLQAGDQKESAAIFAAFTSKDFQGVIERCTQLVNRSGADVLSPELQTVLALSLGAEHRYAEAIQAGDKALAGRAGLRDQIELRLKLAEWHAALGQKSETSALLNEIEQSLAARSLERKEVGARMVTIPPSPTSVPSEASSDAPNYGAANASEILKSADELMKEGRFEEARSILRENRESIQSGTQPDTYEKALEGLEKAEEQYLRDQIGMISTKEQTLSRARQLLEAEKFDEAIATVESLGVEESGNETVRALLDEAESGIVNRERNRAAKAFYLAKQTDDPIKKETFLRSSRDILKQLIDKYPSCSLIEKVKSNLSIVEAEIAKVSLRQ